MNVHAQQQETPKLMLKSSSLPVSRRVLQRACACGKHGGNGGECAECRKKRLAVQRRAVGRGPDVAPPIVPEVLRSPGRPLDDATRSFMESRFNHDFSQTRVTTPQLTTNDLTIGPINGSFEREAEQQSRRVMSASVTGSASPAKPNFGRVRIHTDARAAESARAVDALAYTVGEHIVFGAHQYAPETSVGRYMLAHELTHVEQQNRGGHKLQRWADCKPPRLSLEDCPPRQSGEVQRARSGSMVFLPNLKVPATGEEGVLITNFDIGSAAIKPNHHETLYWKQFLKKIEGNRSQWKILGFTDCQGSESLNEKLRKDRAEAVFGILPPQIKPQIVSRDGAPLHNCVTENNDAAERTFNRSVAFILEKRFADMEPEVVEGKIHTEEPDTSDCNKNQRDALALAFPLAKKMVDAAFTRFDDPALMGKYFGKDAMDHRFHISQNFVQIKKGLSGDPTFQCKEDDSMLCGGDYAYVWPVVGDDIHICEASFRKDTDFLARTIVHESAHRFAWIFSPDDICAGGCPPSMDTEDAEDNADSYGEFAGDAYAKSS